MVTDAASSRLHRHSYDIATVEIIYHVEGAPPSPLQLGMLSIAFDGFVGHFRIIYHAGPVVLGGEQVKHSACLVMKIINVSCRQHAVWGG